MSHWVSRDPVQLRDEQSETNNEQKQARMMTRSWTYNVRSGGAATLCAPVH